MSGDVPPQTPPRRRTLLRVILLYLAFLASGTFALWQMSIFFRNTSNENRPSTFCDLSLSEPASQPADAAGTIRSMMDGIPLWKVRASAPVSPPAGMQLQWALGRGPTRNGYVDLQWVYRGPGPIASVAKAYQTAAVAVGFRLLDDRNHAGRRSLIFQRTKSLLHVSLRDDAQNTKIVHLVVTQTRPGRPDDLQAADRNDR